MCGNFWKDPVGTITGSAKAEDAQKAATEAAKSSAQKALDAQQKNFDLVQSQEDPYRQLGATNASSLQSMLSGGYNMQASPSAQYALGQGTKAINSNLQARGLEGNATQQLGQLSGSTAANDYQNRFNQLLSATQIGQNAVAQTGASVNALNSNIQNNANTQSSIAQSGAQNLGHIYTGAADALLGLAGGAAGALTGGFGGFSGLLGGGAAGNTSQFSTAGNASGIAGASSGAEGYNYNPSTGNYSWNTTP